MLYFSGDDADFSQLTRIAGVEIIRRQRRSRPLRFEVDGTMIETTTLWQLELATPAAEVLGREPDGSPVCTLRRHGSGVVLFCAADLEVAAATEAGRAGTAQGSPAAVLYSVIARRAQPDRAVRASDPVLGLTEHPLGDRERVVVAINYGGGELNLRANLSDGWLPSRLVRGSTLVEGRLRVAAHDASVFVVRSE
jgi:hypothetical protein